MTAVVPTRTAAINRALDPSLESGSTVAQSSLDDTLYVATVDTAYKYSGASSWLVTRTTKTPSNLISAFWVSATNVTRPASIPVTPGEVLSFGVWERCTIPGHRGQILMRFRDASNVVLSSPTGNMNGAPSSDDWAVIRAQNVVVPATAAYVAVLCYIYMPVSGDNTITVGGSPSITTG